MKKKRFTLAAHDAGHARVWPNLPWFVNGTLEAGERRDTESHLATCLVCRREATALGALQDSVASPALDPRCEAALGRLHERIEENERGARVFPRAAAAVLIIVTGLTGLVAMHTGSIGSRDGGKAYRTLGARSIALDRDNVPRARIVFEQDVTERQLRELLLAVDAELIDGPTPRGTYTIAMPRITRIEDLHAAMTNLRQSKRVIFVEPVAYPGSERSGD
jgi:hypothetical protein